MATEHWMATTTRNREGAIPKVNDRITVDGIPADVIKVDEFKGITYQVTIPGLVVDGKQQYVTGQLPWEAVLDLRKIDHSLIDF